MQNDIDTKQDSQTIDFLNEIANFVYTGKYARYNKDEGRRENWGETIDRLELMHRSKFSWLPIEDLMEMKWAFDQVRAKKVVPSMRALQFGGVAIEQNNLRNFNCSVRHIDSIRAFAEVFHLLLAGCGVGVSLQRKYVNRLPNLVSAEDKTGTVVTYVIEDTIEGWSDSIEALLMCYFKNTAYTGRKIVFDYSKIRKKGMPLKTSGGKAPGFRGLKAAHAKVKELLDRVIEDSHQKRLKTINVFDILCHVSDAVLSGGIRRSAMSAVFDYDDNDMMNAKTFYKVDKYRLFSKDEETGKYHGQVVIGKHNKSVIMSEYDYNIMLNEKKINWYYIEPQRGRSNNSVILDRKSVTKEQFENIINRTREFGEPGFVFVNDAMSGAVFNPCFEIGFIPQNDEKISGVQVCNLTSINGAKITSMNDFAVAAKAASIIGTIQAAYTRFKYLSNVSVQITEEESLLGVSITGMMDSPSILLNEESQRLAAEIVKSTNEIWAKKLGINPAARTTCVKPEGSSSLVLGASSGIHPHHARRYFRRVQCNKEDNVYKHFAKHNPHAIESSVWSANNTDDVITFPLTVSDNAIVKSDLTALKHLEIIKNTQINWVMTGTSQYNKRDITHSVSCTVLVEENEWADVIQYLYDNRQYFAAVSLLPKLGDKIYKQAPLEAVTSPEDEERWNNLVSNWKSVDYSTLVELVDDTEVQQTSACAGGACEMPSFS